MGDVLSSEERHAAENILRIMEDRGISYRGMEELTGIPHGTIQNFLQRNYSPKLQTVVTIAAALDVPLGELLKAPPKRRQKVSA